MRGWKLSNFEILREISWFYCDVMWVDIFRGRQDEIVLYWKVYKNKNKNILYYLKEGKEDGYLWLDLLLSENFNLELL